MDSALKYRIVEKIVQSNDDSLLNEIKSLVDLSEEVDFWTELLEDVKHVINMAKTGLTVAHASTPLSRTNKQLDRGACFDFAQQDR